MKRRVIAALAGVAAFGLSAPIASADDLVNQAVVRCEQTSTWQVTIGSPSYADRTDAPAPPSVCKLLTAHVEDDLDFALTHDDYFTGALPTERLTLVGAFVTGLPAFVGVATDADGTVRGPVEIAGPGTLNATITRVTRPGLRWVAEFLPDGSCGTNCYRTKQTTVGTWVP